MIALVRYLTADVLRSHRFFPPLLLAIIATAIFDAPGSAGPALNAYGASALAVYPIGAWFAVAVANAEDGTQRAITAAATGGWRRMTAGGCVVAVLGVLLLVLIGTFWPVVTSARPYGFGVIAIGFAAQLACGWTGVAVGVLCARPLLRKIGWSVLAVALVVVLTFQLGRIPPVGSMLSLLGSSPPNLATVTTSVLASLGIAVLLLTGVTLVVSEVARRRG